MHVCRSILLLSLLTYPSVAIEKNWSTSNLTLELSNFVPLCAEDCFISFLQANYGLERGKRIPSLEELCSTDGETGFTLGEGAVQCIAAESSINGCSDKDASSSAIYNAHQMCSDQPGAIRPTHGVITATLALPPSGAGAVSFPAPSRMTRARKSSKSTGLPSTLVVDTHSLTQTTSSATSTTDFALRTFVSTRSSPAAETSSAAAAAGAASSGGSLTSFQKAGIAVGVTGFAIVAVGLILLFRLYRAKEKRKRERLGTPSRRDSWGYRFDKNSSGGSTGNEPAWMSNPIHPSHDPNGASSIPPVTTAARSTTLPPPAAGATRQTGGPANGKAKAEDSNSSAAPRAYNRTSWRPSAIGLAISPAASKHALSTPSSRPISKLLPAKPLLALAIPKKPSTPPTKHAELTPYRSKSETPSPKYTRISSQPPVLPKLLIPQRNDDFLSVTKTTNKPRESTTTEFEEDGRQSSSISPEGQIWRPPSAAPLSATTYYVADKHGNWILGDPKRISQTAGLEDSTPLSAYPKLATSMTILPVLSPRPKTDQHQTSSTTAAAQIVGVSQPRTQVTAQRAAARRSTSAPNPPAPAQQSIRVVTEPLMKLQDAQDAYPRPLFSSVNSGTGTGNSRHSASARRISGRSLTRPRAPSADSGITTFTISSEDELEGELPNVQQINLSPVTESPRSGTGNPNGRSPVSYPKIPGRETGPTRTPAKLVPPPRMPILYKFAEQGTRGVPGIAVSADKPVALPAHASIACPTIKMVPGNKPNIAASKESRTTAIRPVISVTKVTSPPTSSSRVGPRPIQNAALLRTGSPTMRLVRPSPEPEDDRAKLPSSRPRESAQTTPLAPKQQPNHQLQPSPFPAHQHTSHPQSHPYETRVQDEASQPRQRPPQAPTTQSKLGSQANAQRNQASSDGDEAKNAPPRDQQPQARPQCQQVEPQSQPKQQQDQQHLRPPPLDWIPGLPAHPHPQCRPQHTSTLWLPPQARSTRKMETEPDHHQLTPRRAQLDAQQSLSAVPAEFHGHGPEQTWTQQDVTENNQVFSSDKSLDFQLQLHPQPQPQPYPRLQNHAQQQQRLKPHPHPRPHPQLQYPTHRPQQYAYPYPTSHHNRHNPYPPFQPNSLLAKRLGPQRAADLSISTNTSSGTWHRGGSGPPYLSPETITPRGNSGALGDLPSTPTWLPTLTPTRRGADLYLNVR